MMITRQEFHLRIGKTMEKFGSGFSLDSLGLEVPALFPSLVMVWPACDTRFALLSWKPDVLQKKAYEQMIKI